MKVNGGVLGKIIGFPPLVAGCFFFSRVLAGLVVVAGSVPVVSLVIGLPPET